MTNRKSFNQNPDKKMRELRATHVKTRFYPLYCMEFCTGIRGLEAVRPNRDGACHSNNRTFSASANASTYGSNKRFVKEEEPACEQFFTAFTEPLFSPIIYLTNFT